MGNETPGDESPPGRLKAVAEKHQQKEKTDKTQSVSSLRNSATIFSSPYCIKAYCCLVSLILALISRQWVQSKVVAEEDKSI